MIDYDFIEIGTSTFDTLIEKAGENEVGLSVEPIKKYLDALPNKKNVIKVNTAITSNKKSNSAKIYYIPDEVILKEKMPSWLMGCNSINTYHPYHKNKKKFVKIEDVPLWNIEELLTQYKARKINYLKIDTEGHDCIILDGLFDYLENLNYIFYPQKIKFESKHSNKKVIEKTIKRANEKGYILKSEKYDAVLELSTLKLN